MNMQMPRLKPVMLGGASLAVIAIAVLAVREQTPPRDLSRFVDTGQRNEGQVAAPEPKLEADALKPAPRIAAQPASRPASRPATEAESFAAASPAPATTADESTIRRRQATDLKQDFADDREVAGQAGSRVTTMLRKFEEAPAPSVGALVSSDRVAAPQRESAVLGGEYRDAAKAVGDGAAQQIYQDQGRDNFAEIKANPVKVTAEEPVSTFSIDVDTASYSFVRRALMQGVLPQKDAVRIEEMVNYFPYAYPLPESRETPFRADVQIIPTPWNAGTELMRIGIQGYALTETEKPRSNLVFLIDSSGSMNAPDKLPLLKNSFRLLLQSLDPDDTVAIVTYAGAAGTVLEPTKVSESGKILASLERLRAGGSTAGAEGIRQAYQLAEQSFDGNGVNRVILATDGDFNVGITDIDELKGFVERERKSGVFLSVLGFGQGNLNDALMQTLAQNGNGQAAYIDTLSEARKALVEEAGSTLFPIAKDVKIQVEFNPATVAEYRLIGYETRMLAREDFNNDKVDAGEIGSGHRVTALYEITPVGSPARLVDPSRYQPTAAEPAADVANEYGLVKIRYKAPDGDVSKLITTPVTHAMDVEPDEDRARETRFAAAVAAFGQLLRGGRYTGAFTYDDVASLAQGAKGDDRFGYRTEFVNLVRLAKSAAALEPLKR